MADKRPPRAAGAVAFAVAMTERTTHRVVSSGQRRVQVLVVAAFVVAAIATAIRIPQILHAAKPEPVSAGARTLAPATSYHLDSQLLVSAARDIPRHATYAVVAGDRVRSRFTRIAESTLLAYWLLPRRRTDPHSSEWIVSIGGDLRSLGLRYARVVRLGRGRELAEVER
jgi:hypothetical protein